MALTPKRKSWLAYGWLVSYLILVGVLSAYVYLEALALAGLVLADFSALSAVREALGDTWIGAAIRCIAGVLFCWRAVKVLVLHGSPFPYWMSVQRKLGKGSRLVWMTEIAQNETIPNVKGGARALWFGAIFRAHPTSDKLMRSRLDFLVAAFLGGALVVDESRIYWRKLDRHERGALFSYQQTDHE